VLGGMFFSLMRTLLALLGVCALAWVVLAALARRGIGLGRPTGSARLQIVERLSLSPRRQLYLVKADERLLLLAAGEAGALSLIAELERPFAQTTQAARVSPAALATAVTPASTPACATTPPAVP
jgi:flagellar protein FliO/FliZ